MKKYFYFLSIFFFFFCAKKELVSLNDKTIKGNLKSLKDSTKIILATFDNASKKIDSTFTKNGKFELSLKNNKKGLYIIKIDETDPFYFDFWFASKNLVITGDYNEKESIRINDSPDNDFLIKYRNILGKYDDRVKEVYEKISDEKNIEQEIEKIMQLIREDQINLLFEKPNFLFCMDELIRLKKYIPKKRIASFYNALEQESRNTEQGKIILSYLKSDRIKIGAKFIDFKAKDLKNKIVKLSDFQGKIILLDFMANWCVVCHVQNKEEFTYLHKKYKDELVIVTYSVDDDIDIWKESVKKDTYKWINISNLKGLKDPVAYQYGVHALPHSFLIDKEGVIRKEFIGYKKDDGIEKEIIKILSK